MLESAAATVIIATRHDSHAALARQALERGKHVFLEKPLAITREQLDELRAALRGEGPILTAGFNRRFAPASVALKAFFDGAGEPLVMTARINAGMVPRSHWIQDDAIGGGRIIGECCHFIDWMTFVSGALPVEVHAFAVDASRADFPNRDQLVMSIRFADGSVGSLVYVARGDTRLSKERYEVFAAQRSAVLDDFQQLTTYRDGREQVAWKGSQAKGHRQEAAAFLAAVKGQGAPPIPYEQLFAVTEATFAAEESLRSGLPVRV